MVTGGNPPAGAAGSVPYLQVITPGLRKLLFVVLFLFGLLVANSFYLVTVTIAEFFSSRSYQDFSYLVMFLAHLGLGILLVVPLILFGALHMARAWQRDNRYAKRAGVVLYITSIVVLLTGLLLTRFEFLEINDPLTRDVFYWSHVLAPVLLVWFFILHRLAGHPIAWHKSIPWALLTVVFVGLAFGLHLVNYDTSTAVTRPFEPALIKTAQAGKIAPERLATDAFCGECHADILAQTADSMHRLSSFNNPAYRFSIEDTRRVLLSRDGHVRVAQLCAACHDPVPLLSGEFSDPDYRPDDDPYSQAGITCMGCHAITAVNSTRGNGDYTLLDPVRYPFAFSDNSFLRALNRQLIRAKPALHRSTLLQPVHGTAEFCSVCHKVGLPFELNQYRWLRGQNHYDSFLLSGVAGHRVDSFYYPQQAVRSCAQCHMPPVSSNDPAARDLNGSGDSSVHNHLFAAANTAVPHMIDQPSEKNGPRQAMLAKAARVDIFGLREGDTVDAPLVAPIRPGLPKLLPGESYLLEVVVRNLGVGHALTQGTSDSNELWLDVTVRLGDRIIGRSGDLGPEGDVDPWSYYLNSYLLDREGNRIDRRNAQDIFTALYDHQIPPGAAAAVHYLLEVPDDAAQAVTIDVKLRYRKFDSRFLRHVEGKTFAYNDLPITTLATDKLTLPVVGAGDVEMQESGIAAWERWNDYGIGLLRAGNQGVNKGELRSAAEAFGRVEALQRPEGSLNLARVHFKEGELLRAAEALQRAAEFEPPAPPWTLAWYSALIAREQGNLDGAIENLELLAGNAFPSGRERGFDFSRDYRMLNELGRTLYERARQERGEARAVSRHQVLERARDQFLRVLSMDAENAAAHHNLSLVYAELGESEAATEHRVLHQKFRPDDQAIERAVAVHRSRNPAADHAAEPVAVYRLRDHETEQK